MSRPRPLSRPKRGQSGSRIEQRGAVCGVGSASSKSHVRLRTIMTAPALSRRGCSADAQRTCGGHARRGSELRNPDLPDHRSNCDDSSAITLGRQFGRRDRTDSVRACVNNVVRMRHGGPARLFWSQRKLLAPTTLLSMISSITLGFQMTPSWAAVS
jgi:hypothetical protein